MHDGIEVREVREPGGCSDTGPGCADTVGVARDDRDSVTASDEQTDFEIVYTSAINRKSGREPAVADGMDALLDAILDLPKPIASVEDPLQLQISNLGADPYIGRLAVGRWLSLRKLSSTDQS